MKPLENRVPQIIALYWIIKIAATTLGETGADMFSMTLNIGYDLTILLFMSIFVIALIAKLKQASYSPFLYWLTFTSTAIAGTAISDYIDRTLGLGYLAGASLLLALLITILVIWWLNEKSLSVETITTKKAESFYWLAFLVANTLGTALGDYMADDLALGFLTSASLIGVILLICIALHYLTNVSSIILFWVAFVLTRPFGATFGDFLTKTTEQGGIGLGTFYSSLVFTIVLIIALQFEIKRHRKHKA
jgi:uncharacterized membrane-anchored protein